MKNEDTEQTVTQNRLNIVGTDTNIVVCKNINDLATKAALRITDIAQAAIAEHGFFTIALSGGSTPLPLLKLLATKEYSRKIDWSVTHLFWGDERCVAPDDKESNFKMANDTLLSPQADSSPGIPPENVHRIQAELKKSGVEKYNNEIRDFFNLKKDEIPKFDLMLLGIGTDGHITSIFPGNQILEKSTEIAELVYAEQLDSWRITLTPRVISNTKKCLLLISGQEKAQVLKRLFFEINTREELPVQMLFDFKVDTEWFVDDNAYSEIRKIKRVAK